MQYDLSTWAEIWDTLEDIRVHCLNSGPQRGGVSVTGQSKGITVSLGPSQGGLALNTTRLQNEFETA